MSHQGDARHTAGSSDAHDLIRRRAYELYLSRGGRHGGDFDDWLAAERELADRGEPSALTERVDADAGVLGASSDADVTTGAPVADTAIGDIAVGDTAVGDPAVTDAATAPSPNGKPAPARKAPSKGTATKAAAPKTAPAKAAASKAAAPVKPAATKPAPKSAAKPALDASTPAAPKKPAVRKKGTGGQPTAGNGGAD